MIKELVEKLCELDEVKAIALGGSRATGYFQEDSDYDVYVYVEKHINPEKRQQLISPFVSYMEYSNHFWELEDDGILINGVEIELIYREMDEFKQLLMESSVGHGYSTCFIDNVLACEILYEENAYLTNLKESFSGFLTDDLIQKIVDYNYPIIKDKIPALQHQFEKAIRRNDLHSINHRLTEYFAIYHDILFAINKKNHKGEKRLLTITNTFNQLPKNHDILIRGIYENLFSDNQQSLQLLKELSNNLELLLEELNYIR